MNENQDNPQERRDPTEGTHETHEAHDAYPPQSGGNNGSELNQQQSHAHDERNQAASRFDGQPHPDMVVAHHKSRRFGGRRKLWLVVAIIVVVALAGTGTVLVVNGGFGSGNKSDGSSGTNGSQNGSSSNSSTTGSHMTTEQLSTAINQLYSKQDFNGAVKLAEAQADPQDTQSMLILAAAYTNTQQYAKAFAIYDQLDAKGKLGGADTMTAGEVAQLAGDKNRAIGYFQKAKTRIQAEKQDFSTQRELSFIDEQLAGLQK